MAESVVNHQSKNYVVCALRRRNKLTDEGSYEIGYDPPPLPDKNEYFRCSCCLSSPFVVEYRLQEIHSSVHSCSYIHDMCKKWIIFCSFVLTY